MADDQGPIVVTVSLVFGILAALVVFARIYARVFLISTVGIDDVLIIVALACSWGFIAMSIMAVNHGLGQHIEDVMRLGLDNLNMYAFTVWLSSIFYNATLGFIKVSVLCLYLRVGDRSKSFLRMGSLIMIGIVTLSASANVLCCIFQCSPIPAAWDQGITNKKCIDINAFYLANAATNIFTDILTYALPIKMVLGLQVPKKQKISLMVVLSLGFVACLSSIIRISYIPKMLASTDPSWTISDAMYWSAIETNVGIVAASLPACKVILTTYAPRMLGYYSSGSNNKYSNGAYGSKLSRRNNFEALESQGSQHRHNKSDASVALKSMPGASARQNGVNTSVNGTGYSSEEELTVRSGEIGVRTQITTRYEGSDDPPRY